MFLGFGCVICGGEVISNFFVDFVFRVILWVYGGYY